MKKRILGLFLALSLIVGLLPMVALAEDTEDPAATLVVSSGSNSIATPENDTPSWEPALSEGMTPAYAKTTTEGIVTTDGASENDWNLKVEWTTGGTPTLTLKNATINNNNRKVDNVSVKKDTITIGGTADFVIVVEGTNTLNGSPASASAAMSSYRCPFGISARNTGILTICGVNKETDTLTINNVGGTGINKVYNALHIENVSVTISAKYKLAEGAEDNLNGYPQYGILMMYGTAGNEDKTDLVVNKANLTIDMANATRNYGWKAIVFGKSDSYDTTNTGNIQFVNSVVNITRYSNGSASTLIDTNTVISIDRSDVFVYGHRYSLTVMPTITNYASATYEYSGTSADYDSTAAGTAVTIRKLEVTHRCGSVNDDFNCTTPNTCDTCGEAMGSAQTAHNDPGDDGDCTTAIVCANNGCNVVLKEAVAAHEASDDDGDCTTPVICKHEGCQAVMTPGASSHTSPADRGSCDNAANCTVCGTALAAGQHTGGTATCKDKAVCEVCGESYGELGEHAVGENGTDATCTAKAKCGICGVEFGELAAHTPAEDDGDCTTAVACSVCGGEAVAAKEHTFTDALDTLCDNAGCTHTRVLEPKPDFAMSFATREKLASDIEKWTGLPTGKGEATVIMKAGDATKYYKNGEGYTLNSFMVESTEADWNMKIEYPADGIPTVTLKGAYFKATTYSHALLVGGYAANEVANEGAVKFVIETDSTIDGNYNSAGVGALGVLGKGDDASFTITGPGKLTVISNIYSNKSTSYVGTIDVDGADLIFDNANVTVINRESYGPCHGICVTNGDMTVKGGNVKVVGWDNPETTHADGKTDGHGRINNAMYSGIYVSSNVEGGTACNLTIEGGANVSVAASVIATDLNDGLAIYTDGKFVIKDSTFEVGLVGYYKEGVSLFAALPTLEFTDNKYTVLATKTSKADFTPTLFDANDINSNDGTMTPKEGKEVDPFDSETKITSLTYFKVTAGTGSGSAGSNPNTGDSMNLALWFTLLAVSAAGFVTVLIINKKKFVA